jgi:hypothetical protein
MCCCLIDFSYISVQAEKRFHEFVDAGLFLEIHRSHSVKVQRH